MSRVDISVVLPAHNSESTIGTQLEALANQTATFAWELVVVVHRSHDATLGIANTYTERIRNMRVLQLERGRGAASARNFGAAHAGSALLAFCDADDEVSTGWLSAIFSCLQQHPLVAGKLDHSALNSGEPPMATYQQDGLLSLHRVGSIVSANFGCHKSLWDQLEGMNEGFPHAQDFEFAIRALRDARVRPFFCENASVSYRHRQGLGDRFRQSYQYGKSYAQVLAHHSDFLEPTPRLPRIAIARLLKSISQSPTMITKRGRLQAVPRTGRAVGFAVGTVRHARRTENGSFSQ